VKKENGLGLGLDDLGPAAAPDVRSDLQPLQWIIGATLLHKLAIFL